MLGEGEGVETPEQFERPGETMGLGKTRRGTVGLENGGRLGGGRGDAKRGVELLQVCQAVEKPGGGKRRGAAGGRPSDPHAAGAAARSRASSPGSLLSPAPRPYALVLPTPLSFQLFAVRQALTSDVFESLAASAAI